MPFNGNPENDRRIRRDSARRSRGFYLSHAEWMELLEQTDGLCARCLERPATDADHDHETGKPRGALCRRCNVGLGMLGDNKEGIEMTLAYLTEADSLVEV